MQKKTSTAGMLNDLSKGVKKFFIIAIAASAAANFMSFLTPLIVGFTVDAVIGGMDVAPPVYIRAVFAALTDGGTRHALFSCAAMVIACALLSGTFNFFARVNIARGTEGFVRKLRDNLFSHTQRLPFSWHTKNQTGDIIQRCTSDVETTRRFLAQQLIEVLRIFILVSMALAIMFSKNVTMALVVLLFIPIILGYTLFFYIRISKEFLACDEAEGEVMVRVQENLTGVRVVRAFGRERHETKRFEEKNQVYTDKWLSLATTFGFFWGSSDMVSGLQLLSVIAIGAYLAAKGTITFGDLLVFISYTQTIMWPVRQLGRILTEMSKTGVSLGRIKEIFDEPCETDDENALTPPLDRDISFNNVSFTYDSLPVLKNVSFTVKNGSTLGILGATGSGKSTLTYLLTRLYDLPDGCGEISVGGVDIRQISKQYLRRSIGIVLQEPFLFSKTILENIDIAARGRDLERAREKARAAAVDDSIMSFAKGYDTVVGERGVTLSGGQKQRVAIARTLMSDAPIMVFDDSMSSLDMETDAKIREALRENTGGATVILISHRISTLMTADKIMVLDDGQIAEIGTHAELVENNGHYRRIYDLQSGYTD